MDTHAAKSRKTRHEADGSEIFQKKHRGDSTNKLAGNQRESVLLKLQGIADSSPQARQLKVCQKRTDNSPQKKKAAHLQSMAETFVARQQQFIQKKGNRIGLSARLNSGIDHHSGSSVNNANLHPNISQLAQLKAHVTSQVSDIHSGSGQGTHLPHESLRVLKQKQERVKPTMQLNSGRLVNEYRRLECDADVTGATVTQKKGNRDLGSAQIHKQAGNRTRHPTLNKSEHSHQNGGSTANITLGQHSVKGAVIQRAAFAGDDQSLEEARQFEKSLGQYAFNHNIALDKAETMLFKLRDVMLGDLEADTSEYREKLMEQFGSCDQDSAGQVGLNIERVYGAVFSGNLREQMTAIYNVMFGSFKKYIESAMRASAWNELSAKGLNVEKLKRRKRQIKKDLYRNPGNPLDRKRFGSFEFTGNTRRYTGMKSSRTVGDLEESGIGLSDREKEFQFREQFQADGDLDSENLNWIEGGTRFQPIDTNPWVEKVQETLHMPVIAGPSGTMLRMFQLWEFLDKPVDSASWRLSILGWMLTSNDHSFHEMMMTASDYGLPYQPGLLAYQDIKPLSVEELRHQVAINGLFPHEAAFRRKTVDETALVKDRDEEFYSRKLNEIGDESQKGAMSYIQATILKKYFNNHDKFNALRAGGLKSAIKKKRARGNDYIVKELRAIEASLPMLDNALDMLPDFSGVCYRGLSVINVGAYATGTKWAFDNYGSTSLNPDVARQFADQGSRPFKVIMRLNITSGKDVRQFSDPDYQQILLPVGSRFVVNERFHDVQGGYIYVYLTQIGRGGKALNVLGGL